MLINRSGAMVIPFLTIYLNQELQIPLSNCAIIMACFGAGSVVGSFIGGVLTDRIGFFRVMYTSLFLASGCFILVMTMKTFLALCGSIFILAVVYETFRPANLTAIEAFSKKENLTRSLGLVRLAVNLGYAFGPLMGGLIASKLGYNFLFIFNALAIFLGGCTFYTIFKNKKHRTTEAKITKAEKKALIMPWKDPQYLIYLVSFTITIVVFLQILYTAPLFYKTVYGFDETLVGALMGMNGILIAIIEMPLLFKLENLIKPVICVVIGSFLMGFGFLALIVISAPLVAALVYNLILTFGEILSFPFSNNYAMSFSNDHNRGKYMGLYTMTFSSAHILAPMLGLYLLEHFGYNMLWTWSFVVCTIGTMLMYFTRKKV